MRSGFHGLRVYALDSVFKLHRASPYGDKVIVLVIMLFIFPAASFKSNSRTAQPCL